MKGLIPGNVCLYLQELTSQFGHQLIVRIEPVPVNADGLR